MKKLHKLLLLSIPLLFGAFLLFMIHYSTEHKEVDYLHYIRGGRFALVGKEYTETVGADFGYDTVYKLYLVGDVCGEGYFTYWARCLDFVPSLQYIKDCRNPIKVWRMKNVTRMYDLGRYTWNYFPIYHKHYLVVCSKEDYDSVQVGDYIGVEGTYDDQTPENGMVVLTRQKGPVFNHPDGLILWLYRDLPEE